METEIVLNSLQYFAETVCEVIDDITGFEYESGALQESEVPLSYETGLTVFIQFSGEANGYYVINVEMPVLGTLFGCKIPPPSDPDFKEYRDEANDFFSEILNIAVGKSVVKIEKQFGDVSYVSAISSFGEIYFPNIRSGSIEITGKPGRVSCSFALDLISIKVAKRLNSQKEISKNLEEERNRANEMTKAKSSFVAQMSHDIRTPMNSIVAMTDLLGETQLNSEQDEYVKLLGNSSDLLISLVNNILDFSKIEAGEIELESIPLHIGQLVEETAGILQVPAHDKGLQLNVIIDENVMPYRLGDTTRLRQVILNLVGNAIKFTNQGGITIEVKSNISEEQSGLIVSVADTGIGIPEDKFDTVFQSFSQADSSVTREFGGTGLGLSIVKSFISLMGGEIWIESELGKGTTFIFTLPLPETTPFEIDYGTCDIGKYGLVSPLSVLVADDIVANHKVLKLYFKGYGVDADFVQNGEDAFQKATNGNYDLVLMDLLMPVLNGYDATQKIRNWEKENSRSAIPIFALSAQVFSNDSDEYFKYGFTSYLSKPIKKKDLFEHINALFSADSDKQIVVKKVSGYTENVNSMLQDLIPDLFEDISEDLVEIDAAMEKEDYDSLIRLSHGLKGAAGNYELFQLADIFLALEREAKNGKDQSIMNKIRESVDTYMKSVEITYKEL